MPNFTKQKFLSNLAERYGSLRKLGGSQSLYDIPALSARVYIRYSKVHGTNRTFYGLRDSDIRQLSGVNSYICFLWDGQIEPLLLPYTDYEELILNTAPAYDGQYKVQVYLQDTATELYIAQAGRFNVEGNFGWDRLDDLQSNIGNQLLFDLSHPQVQTLLGAIGFARGFDIWIPTIDRSKLDWAMSDTFPCREDAPTGYANVDPIIQEVDVIWLQRGSANIHSLFEVEHSTPVYSGLLRMNDIHLIAPRLRPRFAIVANDNRRSLYARQINRPTFRTSGLSELCTFLDYVNVYNWHQRTFDKTHA